MRWEDGPPAVAEMPLGSDGLGDGYPAAGMWPSWVMIDSWS